MFNRDKAIEELVSDDMNTVFNGGDYYLSSILTNGFKGYANYSDDELIQELNERDMSELFGENDDEE
jgi:hypothetical protein